MPENSPTPEEVDQRVLQILTSHPVTTLEEVIRVMDLLDEALPSGDGLKWFNLLYLKVTQAVQSQPHVAGWNDPVWLERLDVVFAGLYFQALAGWIRERDTAPRAWQPLFESRRRPGILRVQFALSGMNAHINRDLMLALVQTGREQGKPPRRGSPRHKDFERVNSLLEVVMREVKSFLATGILGEIDEGLGEEDDMVAMWSVRHARDTAWTNAEILWSIRRSALLSGRYTKNIDRLGKLISQGLLTPIH